MEMDDVTLSGVLSKWVKGLRLLKSSEEFVAPKHFLELLLRIRIKPNLILQKKKEDAEPIETLRVVLDELGGYFPRLRFDKEALMLNEWNDSKAKLALAILYICVVRVKPKNFPPKDFIQSFPELYHKILEEALKTLTSSSPEGEPSNEAFESAFGRKHDGCGTPDRGKKRKSFGNFGYNSPHPSSEYSQDSPTNRFFSRSSSKKRLSSKLEVVKGELRTARIENEELVKRIEVLENDRTFSERRITALEASLKSTKADNQNLEALLLEAEKADGDGNERLDRLLAQLRELKKELKEEKEGRSRVELENSVLLDRVSKLQKAYEKKQSEVERTSASLDKTFDSLDEAQTLVESLKTENHTLMESLRKLEEEVELNHQMELEPKPSKRQKSSDFETSMVEPMMEGENMTVVLEARIEDLREDLASTSDEVEKLKAEKAEISSKYDAQVKSAAEKARFIETLTNETKKLKTYVQHQKTTYEDRIANLEMRLAKATKEKNVATLSLQDMRETCEEMSSKIRTVEKEAAEKQKSMEAEFAKRLAKQSESLSSTSAELNTMKAEKDQEVLKLEGQLKLATSEVEALKAANAHQVAELERANRHAAESDEVRHQLTFELKSANDSISRAQLQLQEAKGQLAQIELQYSQDKRDHQVKLDQLQSKFDEKSARLDQLQAKFDEKSTQFEQAVQRLQESDEARQHLIEELVDTKNSYDSFQEKMNDIRSRSSREREEMQKTVGELKNSLEKATATIAGQDSVVSRLNQQLQELQKTKKELERDLGVKIQALESSAERLVIAEKEVEENKTLLAQATASNVDLEAKLKTLENTVNEKILDVEKAEKESQLKAKIIQELEAKVTELNSGKKELEKEKEDVSQGVITQEEQFKTKLEKLENEKAELAGQLEAKKIELEALTEAQAKVATELKSARDEISKLKQEIEEKSEQLSNEQVTSSQQALELEQSVQNGRSLEEQLAKILEEVADVKQQLSSTRGVLQTERVQHMKEREQLLKANFDVRKTLDEIKTNENYQISNLELQVEVLDFEKREAEGKIAALEETLAEQRRKEEDAARTQEKMQSELSEMRVELTNFQSMLQTQHEREREREELVKANFDLRQMLEEERQESANLRSNLETENSGLADQIRSLENSRAELLEELDKSNANITAAPEEVEELKKNCDQMAAAQEKAKECIFDFARKFEIEMPDHFLDTPDFQAKFVRRMTHLLEDLRKNVTSMEREENFLRSEKVRLERELKDLESRKDAELKRKDMEFKDFMKNKLKEVHESVENDEMKYERRLTEKDAKLSKVEKERDEFAAKYQAAKNKIEEIVISHQSERKQFNEEVDRLSKGIVQLKRQLGENECRFKEKCEALQLSKNAELKRLEREKAELETTLQLANFKLKDFEEKKGIHPKSLQRKASENLYETISDSNFSRASSMRDSPSAHTYANLRSFAPSTSTLHTTMNRTISTRSVMPCEDEEGEVFSTTGIFDQFKRFPGRKPVHDDSNTSSLDLSALNLGSSIKSLNRPEAPSAGLKKACRRSHRRSRSLSPNQTAPLGNKSLNSQRSMHSPIRRHDLDSTCELDSSSASNCSNRSKRSKKLANQTQYTKPGPPTPGRNVSLNASRVDRPRKSATKKKKGGPNTPHTPGALRKLLRAGRRSLVASAIDKENVSLVNSSSLSNPDSPANRTRSKMPFRNPFRGH